MEEPGSSLAVSAMPLVEKTARMFPVHDTLSILVEG
jgi:hypothetical protein